MGAPPYSFHRDMWGGQARHTNVMRLVIGDRHVRRVARELNIKAISFFDLALPFHKESCDTRYYLTNKTCGPIGVTHSCAVINSSYKFSVTAGTRIILTPLYMITTSSFHKYFV